MNVAAAVAESLDTSLSHIVAVQRPPMAEYLRQWFTDRKGVPFLENQVPWITAPNGPCDAVDNPRINEIWLQWAARTFKTTFGQAMQCREGQFAPKLMMFATRNENLCKQVLSRFYESLENHPHFRSRIPSPKVRNATSVNLGRSKIQGTWAGSKSGLADESIQVGHANEVDKWEHASTSEEGDPLPRFLKRGGEFPDRKFLIESTPAQHGQSRIERGRLLGSDCRYWVACPHCGRFQQLVLGDGKEPPGIFWEHGPDGHSNIELAEKTAFYICGFCKAVIGDEYRYDMSNSGVWVPAGCHVDHDLAHRARQDSAPGHYPWLKGTPLRDGRIYSSQMSVFHALFHGWGDIAGDYLRKRRIEADWRQWLTEEAGETWRPKQRKAKASWEEVAGKLLRVGCPRGYIPSGFSLVTVQFDRQVDDAAAAALPYVVLAWDHERRCHIVDYDYLLTTDEVVKLVLSKWHHEDGGQQIRASRVLLDAGFEPTQQSAVAKLIRAKGVRCEIAKGSSTPLDTLYRARVQPRESATPGERLVFVDTLRTQTWIEECLYELDQIEQGGLSCYDADPEEHQDLCMQLINEDVDEKGRWDRIDSNVPNDYRDCVRYGKVCMERETRGRAPRKRQPPKVREEKLQEQKKRKQMARGQQKPVKYLDRSGGWI